jgi:uncharacterized protein (DUF1330 family)
LRDLYVGWHDFLAAMIGQNNPPFAASSEIGPFRGDTTLAKGYWIALVDVTDTEAYRAYVKANAIAFRKFGARFLTRGGKAEVVEGQSRSRIVVLEFKDYETAIACYRSPEYVTAMALRKFAALSDVAVVEGYDGPQP